MLFRTKFCLFLPRMEFFLRSKEGPKWPINTIWGKNCTWGSLLSLNVLFVWAPNRSIFGAIWGSGCCFPLLAVPLERNCSALCYGKKYPHTYTHLTQVLAIGATDQGRYRPGIDPWSVMWTEGASPLTYRWIGNATRT